MAEQAVVDQINRMRSQNMSNDEIAQRLLYQGYTNAQVFEAMSQADTTPVYEGGIYQEDVQPAPSFTYQAIPQVPQHNESHIDSSKIEEVAESIIEEKWGDLIESVNKIVEWKAAVESRINVIDEQVKSMKVNFDSLQKAIMGKISDSDEAIREVSTDIKALEQVFKKILPGFVENVNELSRITQKLKSK